MNLVLNTYGATLQKEHDLFVITTPEGRQSFPPDVVRTISVCKSARITSDAILLAIRHQVDVLFVNDIGMPEGRVWSARYGSVSHIRRGQLNFSYGPHALPWVRSLIERKIDGQIALLLALQPEAGADLKTYNVFRFAINSMEDYKQKIAATQAEHLTDVAPSFRGWEGAASKKYFQCFAALMPDSFRFEGRDRMPAHDPFNAMLNYAYGILYGRIEGALIKAGIDPYVGLFHRDEYNRPALVYDVIERYRVWMDYVVLQLCMAEAIPADAFERNEQTGAMLLNPLARRILIQSVHDYLGEIIQLEGRSLSRQAHLEADAHALAKLFLKEEDHVANR